jgi:hypothetical protein
MKVTNAIAFIVCATLTLAGCSRQSKTLFGLTLEKPLPKSCMIMASWTNDGLVELDVLPPQPDNLFTQYSVFLAKDDTLGAIVAHSTSLVSAVPFLTSRFGNPNHRANGIMAWTNSAWPRYGVNVQLTSFSALGLGNDSDGLLFCVGDSNYVSHLRLESAAQQLADEVQSIAERRKRCEEQLKIIGISISTWALDHHMKFPFEVSRLDGGSKESRRTTLEGYDLNAWLHFKTFTKELTPSVLACPDDKAHPRAADWAVFAETNVSYLLRTASSVTYTNSKEVLAVCPIHQLILRCNGDVEPSFMLSDSEREALSLKK